VAAEPPEAVRLLLERRAVARRDRDWQVADELRERIRELGWDPVDGPGGSTARAWLPPAANDRARIGLDEPARGPASVVTIVEDHPADLERLMTALGRHPLPTGTELIVVANAPVEAAEPVLAAAAEAAILRSPNRLGWADAANLGMRQAAGAVIVLLDTSLEPLGDWLSPLLRAFDQPDVGVAGGWGVTSADGRQFAEAEPGEVDAIEGYCLAVRREALAEVGGFDHHFRWYRNADLDLSFAIRARGWRAVRSAPLPLERHAHRGWESVANDERERLSRRNFYRFRKHWGDRLDLLTRG
jgi:cysteinyl-tRNA synthetase